MNQRNVRLWTLLVVALCVTLFLLFRTIQTVRHRPTYEPIEGWMSVIYVARAYRVPPPVLYDVIGMDADPGPHGDHRPIAEIAQKLGITTEELIAKLEARIAQGPPYDVAPPPAP